MYQDPNMLASIRKVEAAREENIKLDPRRMTADEKDALLKKFHPDYRTEQFTELRFGPNIKDWPEIAPLGDNLLLKVASYITDPVTTTDELIPSGETSSYRSNPLGLAEFTLSRKDPEYVSRAKAVQAEEAARRAGAGDAALLAKVNAVPG